MEELHLLRPTLIILAAAILVVPLFRKLRITPVLGYLLAGLLIGPHALKLIHEVEVVETLAEFGVVFLLFSIGLELSLDRLLAMRRHVFGMGTLQVVITGTAFYALGRAVGLGGAEAFVLGGGLALSSTAVVLRMMEESGDQHTQAGRMALAVLLLQDLAVVPLLTVVPLLGGEGGSLLPSLGLAAAKGLGAMALIIVTGRLLLRPVLRTVAAARTPELFTGITLFLALGVSWLTGQAGLSMALGAFLAGLLISETEYRHQVEADIEPFRGLLLALFFMTIGMRIDVGLLADNAALVVGGVVALVLVKALVIAGLARAFGQPAGTAVFVGLSLAQAGEFAFVLFTLAMGAGALSEEVGGIALLVVALSIVLTPVLLRVGRAAADRLRRRSKEDPMEQMDREAHDLRKHVLILGLGRAGRTVVRLLEAHGTEYLGLDLDPDTVTAERGRGVPVFYGDGTRGEVLRAAGLARASGVIVTLDDPAAAGRAVRAIRAENDDIPIMVRARDTGQCGPLAAAGATGVIPELVEGSLQLGGRLLLALGESRDEVEAALADLRENSYSRLIDLPQPGAGRTPQTEAEAVHQHVDPATADEASVGRETL
jgi:CPA2 family monovalent cation:H+ antiporter-2